MLDPRVGMKIYDNVWYLRHRLEPEQAADILAGMGVTYVLAQSKILPMQDTAIESEVTAEEAARFARLDDRAFRDALRDRGIGYFCSLNIGFDPKFIARHRDLLPLDQFGKREEKVDWYIALPPDRKANIDHKIGLLEPAVAALEPDGVRIVQFNEAPAGQSVFHLHFHVIPMYEGVELGRHGQGKAEDTELAAQAKAIASQLK